MVNAYKDVQEEKIDETGVKESMEEANAKHFPTRKRQKSRMTLRSKRTVDQWKGMERSKVMLLLALEKIRKRKWNFHEWT